MSVRTQVQIQPTRPAGSPVTFELLGDDETTGGVGGWTDVPRPRRVAALEWTGTPGMTLVLPLMLDSTTRAGGDVSVEGEVRSVRSWGRKASATGQPPILTVTGPLRVPVTTRWVLDDWTWGEQIRDDRGRRVQQLVTLTLRQYTEAAVLKGPVAKVKSGGRGNSGGSGNTGGGMGWEPDYGWAP